MGKCIKISGPLVIAEGLPGANMFDMVKVGDLNLLGEIIEMHENRAYIQVYEDTSGLRVGEKVESLNIPLCAELGPGLISCIYDGIQRPLKKLMDISGNNLLRGVSTYSVDRDKKWDFEPKVKMGDTVVGGKVLGTVKETDAIEHKIMVPYDISGEVVSVEQGKFCVTDTICRVKTLDGIKEICMLQKWPVRKQRPYKTKLPLDVPLITGQRVIDFLFPIAKGGVAAVPGPFGSGKTVVQHQLAKWSDADIIVYIGCGERGNEMTDVLNEFPEIIDPKTGKSLMERCVLIANTSDMPVAAREASVYTGITIAEYYRDMGYSVALMADSTSRWAEALREMSGRLEEMPGEEGYPAYLSGRLAQFYERAGRVMVSGQENTEGSLTVIGAVSPPGGDISEPVSLATLRIVKVFWGLDSALAYKRHFPAVNWLTSYSLYKDNLKDWFNKNISSDWSENIGKVTKLLSEEASLKEIVQLIGLDALSEKDKIKLEIAGSIREDFLHQNAFHKTDTYSSLKKQHYLISLILDLYDKFETAEDLSNSPLKEKIGRFKYFDEEKAYKEYQNLIKGDVM